MQQKRKISILIFVVIVSLVTAKAMYRLFPFSKDVHQKAPSTQFADSPEECRLLEVVDGDTIHVICREIKTSVRMLRINTPEKGQIGYREAKQALQQLLGKGPVQLVSENPESIRRDRFGRRLAYVFKNGQNINVAMVKLGWSKYWTKYGKGRYQNDFVQAEQVAQKASAGLWAFK